MMSYLLAAVLLSLVSLASAAQPLAIGVQTHFAFDESGTDAGVFRSWMQRSGLASSRDEMFWHRVEDDSGALGLRQGAQRSRQIWASMPNPFAALLILDYGHPGYDSGGQPKSEKARSGFARYADYVTAQAKPQVRWVEVWNEWNMPGPENRELNRGDAKDYVDLARATYRQLKASHPEILVLTGSAGDDATDWKWMRRAIGQGLLAHSDGVAVHLYNHCVLPEFVGSDDLAERLDALRGMVSAAGYPAMPLFITEVGWPTHSGRCGVTEKAAAAHSLRFLLEASLRPWVGGVWFYELQDGGDDPRNQEHRFGLLRRDGTEKPAGCVLRELGAKVAERPFASFPGNSVGAAGFRMGSIDRWLVWTRGKVQRPVFVTLAATDGHATPFASPALCGLSAADMRIDPQGRVATVRLAPGAVHVIDVPAGAVRQAGQLQ